MRALVTGGAGFIGSHLAKSLIDAGHDVVVLDDFSTGSFRNIADLCHHRRFRFVLGSVSDEPVIGPLVERADVVFHLAAVVGVKLVVSAPVKTIETNVNGTAVVLRCAQRHRTRVIVTSTSEVYGKNAALPFREDADHVLGGPRTTRWGYAVSKLLDEFLAFAYWKEHQVPVTVVRFFNAVGPRQSERYGMVLPTFIKRALARRPILVHGDGRQTRSFTWVGDVVAGVTALAEAPNTAGEVFNVGNDQEISIGQLALKVRDATGSDSNIRYAPYTQVFGPDFEDMARRVPDISKIRDAVGYVPKVQLDEIIARTVDHHRAATLTTAHRLHAEPVEPGVIEVLPSGWA